MWHQLSTPSGVANAVELDQAPTQLEMACGLLTPLYAARCVPPPPLLPSFASSAFWVGV